MGSATLVWIPERGQWVRAGDFAPIREEPAVFIALIVVPNSQIEMADGTVVRDYLELCSPDAEEFYKGDVREWGMPQRSQVAVPT